MQEQIVSIQPKPQLISMEDFVINSLLTHCLNNPTQLYFCSFSQLSLINPSPQEIQTFLNISHQLNQLKVKINIDGVSQNSSIFHDVQGGYGISSFQQTKQYCESLKCLSIDIQFSAIEDTLQILQQTSFEFLNIRFINNYQQLSKKFQLLPLHFAKLKLIRKPFQIHLDGVRLTNKILDYLVEIPTSSIHIGDNDSIQIEFFFEDPVYFIEIINKMQSLKQLIVSSYQNSQQSTPEHYLTSQILTLLRSNLKSLLIINFQFSVEQLLTLLKNNLVEQFKLVNRSLSDQQFTSLPKDQKFKINAFELIGEFNQCFLTCVGIKAICEKFPLITQLSLGSNNFYLGMALQIGDISIKIISEELPQLDNLFIEYCGITNKGAIYMRKLKMLRSMRLGDNQIRYDHVWRIMCHLKHFRPELDAFPKIWVEWGYNSQECKKLHQNYYQIKHPAFCI